MTDIPDFKPNVLLIDASLLSRTLPQIKTPMEKQIRRQLPPIDLVSWMESLCREAGLEGGGNEVQVLLVCSPADKHFDVCVPSDISTLDGQATKTDVGEMAFSAIPTEKMVSGHELFTDMLSILVNARGVERLLLVPNRMDTADEIASIINKVEAGMEGDAPHPQIDLFGFGQASNPAGDRLCIHNVFLSIGHAFGIRPDEIG